MKIVLSSSNGPPGIGGNTVVMEMLNDYFTRQGNIVNWIYPSVINCPEKVPGRSLVYSVYSARHILKLAKTADVIQFNSFVGAYTDWIIGKLSKKPSVFLIHELILNLWKQISKTKFEKIILPKLDEYMVKLPFDFFIVPSNWTRNTAISLGLDKHKIKRIPWGIEHSIFHPGHKQIIRKKYKLEDKFIIGWIGRLDTEDKNLKCLFKAFKIAKKEIKDAVLLLAGPNFEWQKKDIEEAGLTIGKDVIYCGAFPKNPVWSVEQAQYYASLDAYVTPAIVEGFGMALLEVQACGTPVICFNTTAMPEIVIHKKTGIVVDDISQHALADAILDFYNKNLKKKLAKNCIKWAKTFNWDNTAKEYTDVYKSLVDKD